jgi:hypothetical protein
MLRWTDESLYIAMSARDGDLQAAETSRDGALHTDDSLEVMLDTEHDGGDAMRSDDYKFFVNILNAQRDSRGAGWPDPSWNIEFASHAVADGTIANNTDTDVGYQLEAAVSWAAWGIEDPAAGTIWGLNISLNDAHGGGTVTQTAWLGPESYTIPSAWGAMMFVDLH